VVLLVISDGSLKNKRAIEPILLMVGRSIPPWTRWARLAGFGVGPRLREHFWVSWKLPGETELGNAGEQPNKG
jgi:hypothetical protein